MKILLLCVFSLTLITLISATGLIEEFTWTRINYVWPKNGQRLRRQVAVEERFGGGKPSGDKIVFEDNEENPSDRPFNRPPSRPTNGGQSTGSIDYRYENNIPMGSNVWQNKLFVTVPRRRLGVPSTLNYIPLDSPNKHNVPLIPYPSWKANLLPEVGGNGQSFVSVYRTAVDPCDRLWFIDTGIIEQPDQRRQVKPTEVVILDLQTERVLKRYAIPTDQLKADTNLASITIDVTKDTCDDAFAYIPDLGGYALLVYSLRDNRSWKINHNYFALESNAGEFFISGHRFQWNDGIFSTELTDVKPDGSRDLYFHSMAGTHMYKVSTKVLNNETSATREFHGDDFVNLGDRGPNSQTSSADIHKPSATMFMGLVNQNALACWNINEPFTTVSIVQKDDQKMSYPCDVKIYNDKLYLLTNTMPGFLYGRLNYDEVNFRVWSNGIQNAIRGTNCVKRATGGYNRGY